MVIRTVVRGMAVVCLLALFAGCVSSSSGRTRASGTPSVAATIVDMGKSAQTIAGNKVTVYGYEAPLAAKAASGSVLAAADVEACAPAGNPTAVAPALFTVETADNKQLPAGDPVKKPALKAQVIAPGRCARGWVTFKISKDNTPQFVVLTSSGVVKWRIA